MTYNAYSHSMLVDSVYARNYDTYFGRVKDPETGAYVKTEFMAQFNIQEGITMPTVEEITYDQGKIVADSCEIWLAFQKDGCYGDTLSSLKMNVLELSKPMSETVVYYSNYDPRKEGYIREDGLKKSILFFQAISITCVYRSPTSILTRTVRNTTTTAPTFSVATMPILNTSRTPTPSPTTSAPASSSSWLTVWD